MCMSEEDMMLRAGLRRGKERERARVKEREKGKGKGKGREKEKLQNAQQSQR